MMGEYIPQTRYPRGIDPQVRNMTSICDVCGKCRHKGKHDKCSKIRQAAGFHFRGTPVSSAIVSCARCSKGVPARQMMGKICDRCHADEICRLLEGNHVDDIADRV